LTAGQTVAKIAAHGAIGGAMGVLQGGKFGHGFITAGLNESLSGKIGQIGNTGGQVAASAILGGTTSSLVGGKFANGAITAAFATAFGSSRQNRQTVGALSPDDYSDVELQDYVNGSPQVAMDLPSFPQWFVDGAAGIGDSITFGTTRYARNAFGVDGGISTDSASYKVGMYGSMAVGGARLTYALGVKGFQLAGSAAGGMNGAYIASTGRNAMKILFRGGLFPKFRIYSFSQVAAKYRDDWVGIITAAGRTSPVINVAGVAAGGGAAANQLELCTQGVSGC
jgi:hypothetical protein